MKRREFIAGPASSSVRLGIISVGTILRSKKGMRVKVEDSSPSAYAVSILDGVPILSGDECVNVGSHYELHGRHLSKWEKENG